MELNLQNQLTNTVCQKKSRHACIHTLAEKGERFDSRKTNNQHSFQANWRFTLAETRMSIPGKLAYGASHIVRYTPVTPSPRTLQ